VFDINRDFSIQEKRKSFILKRRNYFIFKVTKVVINKSVGLHHCKGAMQG
jgi:hypothetical protein